MKYEPRDMDFEKRVRDSFDRQGFMKLLGLKMVTVEPGHVVVEIPFREELTQQQGNIHAGVISTALDVACGYAAYTLMPRDSDVVSVEFKVNMLAPAVGERFLASARVLKSGRTLTVSTAELTAERDGRTILIAAMQATMMSVS
ncbi:MAG: PaaI family thioesterase [Syntrophales bacterium]|nr:PaaI family thioesterase [Syntrophales bacterium]MCK9527853.1 PaaI family thioesterase [Syntrophales bacterium]MDX9922049.1 PaaI family thioesterase [Syntrophales bacterium]